MGKKNLKDRAGVRKRFSSNGTAVEALRGIGFEIKSGEFTTITGESGSGKSTLLSILGGIAPPTEGTVVVDSIPIYELSGERLADFRREYIGFVFQQFHLEELNGAGQTVVVVTHNPELSRRAGRTIRMKDGLVESDIKVL
jgi:putative ABC transport system ATP-binding protein